jgi:hypothetical protein
MNSIFIVTYNNTLLNNIILNSFKVEIKVLVY